MIVISDHVVPAEVLARASNVRLALREVVVDRLRRALPAAVTLRYRPSRAPVKLPAVTFFDSGTRIDPVAPVWDRRLQVDVFSTDMEESEALARKVEHVLNLRALPLPDHEGRVFHCSLSQDFDDALEDGELLRKTLVFLAVVVDHGVRQPFR